MPPLRLRTAFWSYDRTLPLLDGRVRVEGAELDVQLLRPEETFSRAYEGDGFDVCEASFSNTLTACSKHECPYVLIPAFLSRAFRHSAFYVRSDRGIAMPGDLRGRRIGLQEYGMTAAVVARGLLRDHYHIDPAEITWVVGDGDDDKPPAFPKGHPPDDVRIIAQRAGQTVAGALLAGELDAAILLRAPPAVAASATVRPLFADPARAERDWFQRSGIFPIMHAVGLRRELDVAMPDLALRLYRAFSAAKDLAVDHLGLTQVPMVTLPWPHDARRDAQALMGSDYWSYGIAANRAVLETQMRWSREDGLQRDPLSIEDVFAAGCMAT